MLDASSETLDVYLDADEEVFFGPVTQREREIRKLLPRRTLLPAEIAEMRHRGMTYLEWEAHADQIENNIFEPNGKDDESLNDTWEIQEKMLALAEKLEQGEDIPELGIFHVGKDKSREISPQDKKDQTPVKPTLPQFICETPSKDTFNFPRMTPSNLASCHKTKSAQNSAMNTLKCKKIGAHQPSPVGMYIRCLPEPMLIENIRPTTRKQFDTAYLTIPEMQKENVKTKASVDVTPVLPAVIHTAAASLLTDGLPERETTVPTWYRGKIGKLLERNVTPSVYKHQGRIKIPKTNQINQSPKSFRSEDQVESNLSIMDVSVLEHVSCNALNFQPFVRKVPHFKK